MTGFTPRQREIIDASIELIAKRGIQQLTIKNLSGKIGTTEGAIYRHFDSKTDILLGILSTFEANKNALLLQLQSSESADAMGKLREIFETLFARFSSAPAMAAVIFSEEIFQNDKRLSEKVYSIMKDSQEILRGIIEAGQKNGQLRTDIPDGQLAIIIIGALRLTVTRWRLSEFRFDLKSEGKRLWKSIERILTE